MKKILIVVLSEVSTGELTIGYEFASRLNRDRFDVSFLIPEKHIDYLKNRNEKYMAVSPEVHPKINKSIIDRFIKEFNPDFFLLSDVFTTEYSQQWSGLNFEEIRKYNIPVIGIDEYEYLAAGVKLDYYGGLFKRLPPLVDKCDYIIRNCPLNTVRKDQDKKIKCFSLFKEKMVISDEKKARVRKGLSLEGDEKLVFFTTSAWEVMNYHRIPALAMLVKWMPIILKNYLASLNKKILLLHVGPNPIEDFACENVRYINYTGLVPTEFDDYLCSSDLFITFNSVSVTLSKAVYAAVPSLVFQNCKMIDFTKLGQKVKTMPLWYQEMAEEVKIAYPFRASVFGWYELLKTVMEQNDYIHTYIEVPIFKHSESLNSLNKYLYDKDAILALKEKQVKYAENMLNLPDPNQIMDEIILANYIAQSEVIFNEHYKKH